MSAPAFPIPLPPASALALLQQARDSLAEAERTPEPPERFAVAYLAALRAAAAVLALRGRPHRGRSRPTSAWVLLAAIAPEMREWAAFFAAEDITRNHRCKDLGELLDRVFTWLERESPFEIEGSVYPKAKAA